MWCFGLGLFCGMGFFSFGLGLFCVMGGFCRFGVFFALVWVLVGFFLCFCCLDVDFFCCVVVFCFVFNRNV